MGCGSIVDRPCSQGAHVPVREPGHKPDAVVTALVLVLKAMLWEPPEPGSLWGEVAVGNK